MIETVSDELARLRRVIEAVKQAATTIDNEKLFEVLDDYDSEALGVDAATKVIHQYGGMVVALNESEGWLELEQNSPVTGLNKVILTIDELEAIQKAVIRNTQD